MAKSTDKKGPKVQGQQAPIKDKKERKPREKKEKTPKPTHPKVGDEKVYPFKSLPSDYVFGKMAPLKKKDFSKVSAFMSYKAAELKWKAEQMERKAEEIAKTGDNKTAKKLIKVQDTLANLRKELIEQGLDPDEILAAHAALVKGDEPEADSEDE